VELEQTDRQTDKKTGNFPNVVFLAEGRKQVKNNTQLKAK
jgi:hypothetical protein